MALPFISRGETWYNRIMGKTSDTKTNVMRILERQKIPFEVINADIGEFKDGITAADMEGMPHEETYKTLVAEGKSRSYLVYVIPVEKELDLKKAARTAGEKSVAMLHVKDITAATGYVRGGCSPIGMKKHYRTFIDRSAEKLKEVYVSGGRIGTSVKLSPEDLLKASEGELADLIVD